MAYLASDISTPPPLFGACMPSTFQHLALYLPQTRTTIINRNDTSQITYQPVKSFTPSPAHMRSLVNITIVVHTIGGKGDGAGNIDVIGDICRIYGEWGYSF